jgi:hypothetical protein
VKKPGTESRVPDAEVSQDNGQQPAVEEGTPPDTYEPPQLRKYGSLADLTRSGTGTAREGGKGPARAFA